MKDYTELDIIDYRSHISDYLIDLFVNCVIECSHVLVEAQPCMITSALNPSVIFQIYYDSDTNRCFIEVGVNKAFRYKFGNSVSSIKAAFSVWIAKGLKNKTSAWPEVVFPEDSTNNNCANTSLLTPFTIGYWKSLSGKYRFIQDKVKVLREYNNMAFPDYDEEYKNEAKQIFDEYYKSDFNLFNEKMYELNTRYNINLDPKPRKDFADFISTVKNINDDYAQVELDDDTRNEFDDKYMALLKEYAIDKDIDTYNTKLRLLYDEYGIISELNNKVPEIFEKYKEAYLEFFEKELDTFEFKHANDDEVEIWTYEGDFDFGVYINNELIVDPDSVAVRDYEYNKAAEYEVYIAYYDIIEVK